jgi:hypothetical protein
MIFRRLTPIGHVMRRARRWIERKDWSQGRYDGIWTAGPCAAHAIVQTAFKLRVDHDAAIQAFADHNDLPFPRPGYTGTQRTTNWNDTPGRTKVEVLAAFRKAEAAETAPGWFG